MSDFNKDTADLAGDYLLAEAELNHARKRIAAVLKSMFGTTIMHCDIQDRTLHLDLTIDSIAEDFPRKLFSIGFNSVIIKLANGSEKTWVDPKPTDPNIG